MEIFTLIRDGFVSQIWGGVDSAGNTYSAVIGDNLTSTGYTFTIGDNTISMSDWLSTTSTIIVIALMVFALGLLLIGLFRLFRGLFSLRG